MLSEPPGPVKPERLRAGDQTGTVRQPPLAIVPAGDGTTRVAAAKDI